MVSRGALLRFRVMAWVTGVWLILLTIGMIAKYGFGVDSALITVVATVHGWAYLLYVITAFYVATKLHWSLGRTVLLLLAGTVPFCSFVAERKVMQSVRADQVVAS